jgi:hypothetical protein
MIQHLIWQEVDKPVVVEKFLTNEDRDKTIFGSGIKRQSHAAWRQEEAPRSKQPAKADELPLRAK